MRAIEKKRRENERNNGVKEEGRRRSHGYSDSSVLI
jgi:hypothetical protein